MHHHTGQEHQNQTDEAIFHALNVCMCVCVFVFVFGRYFRRRCCFEGSNQQCFKNVTDHTKHKPQTQACYTCNAFQH